MLRCHRGSLYRHLRSHRVPGVKVGGRWFVSSVILDRIVSGDVVGDVADLTADPAPDVDDLDDHGGHTPPPVIVFGREVPPRAAVRPQAW